MVDFTVMVDDEDLAQRDSHRSVRDRVRVSVAETAVERVHIIREQVPDVLQSRYFEHLRFPVDDFPFERPDQPVRTHNDRSVRHVEH